MNPYVLLPSSIVPLKEKASSFTQLKERYYMTIEETPMKEIPWAISTGKRKMQLEDSLDN